MAYEIKILRGKDPDVQKTLNQWKHQYSVKVGGFQAFNDGTVCALVCRSKKES